jgi:hypothetical protein
VEITSPAGRVSVQCAVATEAMNDLPTEWDACTATRL